MHAMQPAHQQTRRPDARLCHVLQALTHAMQPAHQQTCRLDARLCHVLQALTHAMQPAHQQTCRPDARSCHVLKETYFQGIKVQSRGCQQASSSTRRAGDVTVATVTIRTISHPGSGRLGALAVGRPCGDGGASACTGRLAAGCCRGGAVSTVMSQLPDAPRKQAVARLLIVPFLVIVKPAGHACCRDCQTLACPSCNRFITVMCTCKHVHTQQYGSIPC